MMGPDLHASCRGVVKCLLFLCACLVAVGCGSRGRDDAAAEAKVLARLGDSPAEPTGITAGGSDKESLEKAKEALKAIRAEGKTLAEKVKACRQVARGIQVELSLATSVPMPDIHKEIGTPHSESKREFLPRKKEIGFFAYGNLEVGIEEGQGIVVVVR